jgi:hypothetical protein
MEQESEVEARKLARQLLAQRLDIFCGRPVIFLQLYLDVAVLRPDYAGVIIGHVDAADRHADVVGNGFDLIRRNDLANGFLDVGKLVGGLLDTGADLGSSYALGSVRYRPREEVTAEIRRQQKRCADKAEEPDYQDGPMSQCQLQ